MLAHSRKLFVTFFLLSLFVLSLPSFAQEDSPSLFTVANDDAVIDRGEAQYTDPGGAVYHDDMFHMFHNRFTGWPSDVDIYYSTSTDGINWELVSDEPVFSADGVDYAGKTLLASSILVEGDDKWAMYFYTWESTASIAPASIGRAIASSPEGPWVADDAPILVAGSSGEWDALQVASPTVIKTGDGYVMYYTGATLSKLAIGMATSEDGITWEKYDDPETTDKPFAESDPIIVELGNPDLRSSRQKIWQPRVVVTREGWVMLYKSGQSFYGGATSDLGLAVSADGIEWNLLHDLVPIDHSDLERGRAIWFTELVYTDENYYLYLELGLGSNTDIYVATYSESIKELLTD